MVFSQKSLYSCYGFANSFKDRIEARIHAYPIDKHCTGTALAHTATFFWASHLKVFPEDLQQHFVRVHFGRDFISIESEMDNLFHSCSSIKKYA
jgi:hypothetical protein